jgi:IrrE N-terminal-like domain
MTTRPPGFRSHQGRTYATIEQLAAFVRKKLNLPGNEPIPGLQLFENIDRYYVQVGSQRIPLTYHTGELPPGVEAQARYEKDDNVIALTLSPETYAELERDKPRARFSLGHEIGHIVLHPNELLRLATIPHTTAALLRATAPDHPIYLDTEWQAHAFAGALLMPAAGLAALEARHGRLDLTTVRRTFNVSTPAAEIRLRVFNERRAALLNE